MALLDDTSSGLMRAVLHHPHFQALEATWRGLDFLLRTVETDEELTVSMLDLSRAELASDLLGVNDLAGIIYLPAEANRRIFPPIRNRPADPDIA